jgi:hypothetical protein
MATVAWMANEFASALPLQGILLEFVQVATAIVLATVTFYLGCRLLKIEELNEAVTAIGGRLLRPRRRK